MINLLKEAWTLAIEALSWMQMQKLSEPLAFAKTVKQLNIQDPDAKRLARMLIVETVRRRNFIDKIINNTISPETMDEFDLGVQAFLRLYVYQTRAVKNWKKPNVEEAENIAKLGRSILGWKTIHKIEHMLGFLLTQNQASAFQGAEDAERTGLLTFHPTWFVKYCFRLFGRSESITMLEANNQLPPTYVRLNTLKTDEKQILERLGSDGFKIEKVEGLKHTYEFKDATQPITTTASFREGLFYIQDKASCFAVEAADPKPEMTVLDVCAAPGAKTTYLAQLMQNKGAIYAVDYSKRRMNTWKNEVDHMGVTIAEPIIIDARKPLPIATEADVIVLDPPCTSTGTFGKLPSAKWRLTPDSVNTMARFQWQMINSCAEYVKNGGTLIYSTCSITVEENEMIIEKFLKQHTEFSLTEITPKLGLSDLRGLDKCQRLYPHIHRCNGFFIAKIKKET